MDRESVRRYIDEVESAFETSPQMNEANTKAAVLRDFLNLLNWEIPANTELEYSVEAFGQTYRVDYALILEGTPVAFIEAKGADTALTTAHNEQLSSYMMNENVNYGILTNGKQFRFFQRCVNSSNVDVKVVGDIQLENLSERLTVLEAYTKEAIESGESGKILGRINELQEARSTLRETKDNLATEIADMLSERVSDTISSLAKSQSKELIDRLVEDIESEIDVNEDTGGSNDTDIEPINNHIVRKIKRSEITGGDDARVAVFPTKESGIPFMKENNAWGFVRVGKDIDYVAMYVTRDAREVRYFATVKDIVAPEEADLERPPLEYVDRDEIGEQKMVVRFEPDSLYELEDPIPYETKYPQGLRYTTLAEFKTAETTDDML